MHSDINVKFSTQNEWRWLEIHPLFHRGSRRTIKTEHIHNDTLARRTPVSKKKKPDHVADRPSTKGRSEKTYKEQNRNEGKTFHAIKQALGRYHTQGLLMIRVTLRLSANNDVIGRQMMSTKNRMLQSNKRVSSFFSAHPVNTR